MKRLIGALAALALMCGALSASAEDIVLEGRSLEELYGLRERLERQITALEQADDGVTVDAGTYQVGRDIPAGDYVVTENQDAMFASVMVRESADEASALVSHDLVNGQCVIRLREGTWVTLNEVVAVPIAQAEPITDGIVPEGSYLVGSQLPAGRYAVTPVEGRAPGQLQHLRRHTGHRRPAAEIRGAPGERRDHTHRRGIHRAVREPAGH